MGKRGRPTKYNPEMIEKVDEYIASCQDEERAIVKGSSDKTEYTSYDYKIKVSLPTIEGFSTFLDVNKTTVYEWAKEYKDFSNALEKIEKEQKKRLIEKGLSGDYNPTIAKLVLSANHGMAENINQNVGGQKDNPINIVVFKDKE